MHDTTRLESRGIPTVAVATSEFVTAGRAQASALGRSDLELVYVPHPIQDQTESEIRAKADASCDEIVARLTASG